VKKIIYPIFVFFTVLILSSCSSCDDEDSNIDYGVPSQVSKLSINAINIEIPTLVIVMNWSNIELESDPQLWHNKIFDESTNGINSVNQWYKSNTDNNVTLVPVLETSGTTNDGVIILDMGANHPSGDNDANFRDTYITQAMTNNEVITNIDFSSYDTDTNGFISSRELQVIFIVAGGEAAYNGSTYRSVWAHSWYYERPGSGPYINGVTLMTYSDEKAKLGAYAVFGSTHKDILSDHKATIGIIAHELGHSLYNLVDLYDVGFSGSGIGYYDIMSNGTWGQVNETEYAGTAPTQFSSFSKLDMNDNVVDSNLTAESITIKCSENEFIKIPTRSVNEYFLVECRDTAIRDSELSLNYIDNSFTTNRLFGVVYQVDEDKETNNENGLQTKGNHYKVRVVERNVVPLMTGKGGIDADFSDVYITGHILESTKTKSYEGEEGHYIRVLSSDYNNRTMTFKITQ